MTMPRSLVRPARRSEWDMKRSIRRAIEHGQVCVVCLLPVTEGDSVEVAEGELAHRLSEGHTCELDAHRHVARRISAYGFDPFDGPRAA